MNIFKKTNGWIRLFIWGYCPECNGDSPKYFECKICDKFHFIYRYKKPDFTLRNKWWNRFKNS